MIINGTNLRSLYTGFSTAYQAGFAGAASEYGRIATTVPSSTSQNEYGWLGKFPKIREWIGPRVVHALSQHAYTIKNKRWELTIGVDVDDIEDDNLGLYNPLFTEIGRETAAFPDEHVFGVLKAGFSTACYDKQYFFDTDHPVLDADGRTISVSNSGGGAGAAWYLMDTTRALKPIVFQNRRSFEFRRMDAPTDEVRFTENQARYGVDGRNNVGFGFWQLAYGSKQPLTPENYEAARVALMEMKGDFGRPLGVKPNLLVVPPSLGGAGREILVSERDAAGATNKWRGTAEILETSWLA
ncbi:Mu-like prophage major head subunit gpT family protein [Plastoroseomonas hellenica]|uniref:Mu-like prophage major head subunit gpT family protein n=1 Tax=Plastoroseomonas hellenica TaxID=2687306 RepID=UPI001BA867AA|nr:hypothetical protein [Plastoroseomonas hellenica]